MSRLLSNLALNFAEIILIQIKTILAENSAYFGDGTSKKCYSSRTNRKLTPRSHVRLPCKCLDAHWMHAALHPVGGQAFSGMSCDEVFCGMPLCFLCAACRCVSRSNDHMFCGMPLCLSHLAACRFAFHIWRHSITLFRFKQRYSTTLVAMDRARARR